MRLIAMASIVFLSSCTNDKEQKVYQALDNGFVSSYKLISSQNEMILRSLENKKMEPLTVEKATVWYAKALAIQASSDGMKEYIEKLKPIIRKEEEKVIDLYDSLERYKQYVLNIDPTIKREFYNNMSLFDSSIGNDNDALQAPFL